MADKIKTKKQGGGVNSGRDSYSGRDTIGGNKISITLIGTGAVVLIILYLLLAPRINPPSEPPLPTPTPLSFALAAEDETLLIVADYDDRSAGQFSGIDSAQRAYDLITKNLPSSNKRLRVEQYHHPIKDAPDAQRVLKAYDATVLIWGWYDKLGGYTQVAHDQDKIALQDPTMPEFNLTTPDSVPSRFGQDAPAQATYVAYLSLGMMQLDADRVDASVLFNKAIEIASVNSSGAVNPWEALMWRGNIYAWSGEHDLAIADYTQALTLYPHREGYFNRGNSYSKQGNLDAAIADYTKAIEIDPKYNEAYAGRAFAYSKLRNYVASIADYTKAIEIAPGYNVAYFNRGAVYHTIGEYDNRPFVSQCVRQSSQVN
jgi:tetratricopeptide (TPR) repeat protein